MIIIVNISYNNVILVVIVIVVIIVIIAWSLFFAVRLPTLLVELFITSSPPRIFQVPRHPCLVSRRSHKDSDKKSTSSVPEALNLPIRFQNFIVDVTTLRITVEALRRSTDVDTLSFHNAGLSDSAVGILIEGLPHTTVRCLRLDYNTPSLPPSLPKRNEASSWPMEAFTALVGEEGEEAGNPAWSSRNFPGLLREGGGHAPFRSGRDVHGHLYTLLQCIALPEESCIRHVDNPNPLRCPSTARNDEDLPIFDEIKNELFF